MKNRTITTTVVSLLITLVFGQPNNYSFPEFAPVKLSENDVEKFIREFPSLKTDFEKLDNFNHGKNDLSNYMEAMKASAQANNIVKKHGYTDFVEFLNTTWTIATSFAAIKTKDEAYPEFEQAIKEIEANPHMSAEDKKMAIEQMQMIMSGTQQSFLGMASEENIRVVKRYTDKLEFLFDEE